MANASLRQASAANRRKRFESLGLEDELFSGNLRTALLSDPSIMSNTKSGRIDLETLQSGRINVLALQSGRINVAGLTSGRSGTDSVLGSPYKRLPGVAETAVLPAEESPLSYKSSGNMSLILNRTWDMDLRAIRVLVMSDWSAYLLVFSIMGAASGLLWHTLSVPDWVVFTTNFIAMIPLARIIGDATEEISAGLQNETIGGLLNATFGNAVEMIVTFQTVMNGLISVTKNTLFGSILSNMLLVLGSAFFCGGLGPRNKEQKFRETGPMISMTMLFLALMSFAVPTAFYALGVVSETSPEASSLDLDVGKHVLYISRVTAVLLFVCYVAYLIFQLITHREVFEDDVPENSKALLEAPQDASSITVDLATMSVKASALLLFTSTLVTAINSEFLVSSIEGMVAESGISQTFIGVVLLPFIGNACEHVSAIRMAMHEKPVLAIGIAVGSSTQIALLVIPLSVIFGWILGVPMDLNFGTLNCVILTLSVLIVTTIVVNGKSNWLEGFMLVVTYFVVCSAYWFLHP